MQFRRLFPLLIFVFAASFILFSSQTTTHAQTFTVADAAALIDAVNAANNDPAPATITLTNDIIFDGTIPPSACSVLATVQCQPSPVPSSSTGAASPFNARAGRISACSP